MVEKTLDLWPEGTKIKNLPKNKKEVVFPKPFNAAKYNREQRKKRNKREVKNYSSDRPSYSGQQHGLYKKEVWEDRFRPAKKYPTRQERLTKEKRVERKFKEKQQAI